MYTETAPGGRRPSDQANRLEPQARLYRQPIGYTVSTIAIYYHYSARKHTHFTVLHRVEG